MLPLSCRTRGVQLAVADDGQLLLEPVGSAEPTVDHLDTILDEVLETIGAERLAERGVLGHDLTADLHATFCLVAEPLELRDGRDEVDDLGTDRGGSLTTHGRLLVVSRYRITNLQL